METSFRLTAAVEPPPPAEVTCGSTTMSFNDFYRAEFPKMEALARSICGNHQYAEDIAQEALARAHRNWAKIESYEKPGAWLRRVTINLSLSRRRRVTHELSLLRRLVPERRMQDQVVDQQDMPGTEPDQEVWDAVRKLPPNQRAVIALFYQEDLSTREIAEIMGCAISTTTSHLNQARTKLAAVLSEPIPGDVQ